MIKAEDVADAVHYALSTPENVQVRFFLSNYIRSSLIIPNLDSRIDYKTGWGAILKILLLEYKKIYMV